MKYDKYNKHGLYKRTFPYLLQNKCKVLFCIISSIIIASITTLAPRVLKEILDKYIAVANSFEDIDKYSVYILFLKYIGLILIVIALKFSQKYVLDLTGMRIEKSIREDAIRKIDYLAVDYYSLEPDGKIVSKITNDSASVKTFITVSFSIAQALINLIALYIGFILLDYHLALIILIFVPIIILWVTLYRRKLYANHLQIRELSSRITGKLNELISGALIIEAFNQEELMLKDYEALVSKSAKLETKTNTINAYFGMELLNVIKRIIEASILLFFGIRYIDFGTSVVTIGTITTFTDYLDKMVQPVNTIFMNLNELEDSIVACNRVYMFIDEENDTRIFDGLDFPTDIKGDVEFRDVHFSYVENKEVLHGISLKVKAGEKIAIVGHTGSGKSSLMNLLLQYNDYQSGQILVDSMEINKYNKASYRKALGIVLQTPAIFSGTIKSNVCMDKDYPDDVVIDVLKQVGAGYLLEKTSKGIYEEISFKGENLSLGEKQLICFARILLRKPKILVLDEATANIDTETEIMIKKACDVVANGRTTFIIAHRLSTVKDCDKIIVLDHGLIKGVGSHEELYKNCSIYKDMYESQYKTIMEYELTHN